MKTKQLWIKWLYLFVLCAALSFIPESDTFLVNALLVILKIAFFIPGALLVGRSGPSTIKKVMLLSGCSLTLTTGLIIFNYASVLGSDTLGNFAYILLRILATPMTCGPIWVISLFGWACLLAGGMFQLPKYR